MARRGYTSYEQRPNAAEQRRRKRQALQAKTGRGGGGFVAPQQQGVTAQQPQQGGQPTLADFARFAQSARKMGLPRGQVQGMLDRRYGPSAPSGQSQMLPHIARRHEQRRYGQQQGFGQGYQPPRRAIGGFQQPYGMGGYAGWNANYMGYSPRTAGMYGGRPSYGGNGRPMNQAQAMMRPQYSYGAQVRQPWGGYNAVQRYNPQRQYGYNRGWY